jgi:hypothetical protein
MGMTLPVKPSLTHLFMVMQVLLGMNLMRSLLMKQYQMIEHIRKFLAIYFFLLKFLLSAFSLQLCTITHPIVHFLSSIVHPEVWTTDSTPPCTLKLQLQINSVATTLKIILS